MDKKETLTGNGNVAIHDWEPYNGEGIHKNADEIEHDIIETRHIMDEILDTLSSRVNPGNFVNRVMNSLRQPETREKTRDVFYDTVSRVSSSFQRNPLPLMIVAAGVTWQLWETQQSREQPGRSNDLRSAKATAESKFSEKGDQIKSTVAHAQENLRERFSSAGETARNAYKSNEEKARNRFDELQTHARENQARWRQESGGMQAQVNQSFRHTSRRTDQLFHDNPLLVGLAATFAGLLLGSLIPESRTEHHVLGETPDDVVEKTTETALDESRKASQSFAQKAKTADLTPEKSVSPEEHKDSGAKPEKSIEKPQPVTPPLQKSANLNQSEVLKTAEQKIDEKKNK